MRTLLLVISTSVLGCCFPSSQAHADFVNVHISVDGAQSGKGFAVSRGLDCFILTAWHVVQDPLPISVMGVNGKISSARVFWEDPDIDLAVLKLDDPAEICGRDGYIEFADLDHRLSQNRSIQLRFLGEDGATYEEPLLLMSSDSSYLHVEPTAHGHVDLGQGLSGSMLSLDGEPVGLLIDVNTNAPELGRRQLRRPNRRGAEARAYRIDRIQERVGHFLPLAAPSEDRARLDDQLAGDMLHKHVNYMRTRGFCRALWRLSKWVANPDKESYTYDLRRQGGVGGGEYVITSMLLPGVQSVYRSGSHRWVTTTIGFVPGSLQLGGVWSMAEAAVNECLLSDVRKEIGNIRVRTHMLREAADNRTTWTVERTLFLGAAGRQARIWLMYDMRAIVLRIWTID